MVGNLKDGAWQGGFFEHLEGKEKDASRAVLSALVPRAIARARPLLRLRIR